MTPAGIVLVALGALLVLSAVHGDNPVTTLKSVVTTGHR